MKIPAKISLFLAINIIFNNSIFCGTADTTGGCSVKNRWVLKPSISSYLGWEKSENRIGFGDYDALQWNVRHINFRIEASYGLSKCWELGLFAGFQHHATDIGPFNTLNEENGVILVHDVVLVNKLSPTFGFSANFHLLPLFVLEERCRWDLYLTANYGGCILINLEIPEIDSGRYRQEYGAGVGLSYYIKNRAGFFAEFRFGNYSLFPKYVDSYSNFRVGLALKLN